ncbi:chemotaxis protein CheB [Laspinema olomoucense]|uniref:chemotaxis protein CheB n=1 Tax=Laspinema olomoucense TaxID=3231600 RepID=UPI0021BB9D53|nr:chemotaxis protein CheB [Laspinema sp. D3c]MCT7993459.1 chemotaxis protein CheB [Laspinema sp. D3c]
MSISKNKEKAAQKILCIGGSTLNEGTIEKIKDALIATDFLQEWAVIFVKHLYFFVYGSQFYNVKTKKDIEAEWAPNQTVFVDHTNIYSVNKQKIYILPDPDICKVKEASGWNPMKNCLVVNCKVENNLVKLEAVESKGIDKNLDAWLKQNMDDASNSSRVKDLLNDERLEMPCIDKFMMELADVKTKINDLTIAGLILCGCYGDGAYGLKAIKNEGGATAVQDPDECWHSQKRATWSMPSTALENEPNHEKISIEENSDFTSLTDWLKSIR